jgi:hypothetical protein
MLVAQAESYQNSAAPPWERLFVELWQSISDRLFFYLKPT